MKKVVPIQSDHSEEIFQKIKGKPFFAVSYDKETGKFIRHINNMSPTDVVFSCTAMIKEELRETAIWEDVE